MINIPLKDLELGYADADKEFIRIPNFFDSVFYDPQNIIDKLLKNWEFLLVGRKGVGKSAFSAKLRSMNSDSIFTVHFPLNDFEYSTFDKTSTDKNITGTQKFKLSWDFILLLSIYKTIFNELETIGSANLDNVSSTLDKLGFNIKKTYKQQVNSLSKLKIGVNLKVFDLEFEKQFGEKPTSYSERISTLINFMVDELCYIFSPNCKLLILIDGVDDILRFKKNQLEILSCLIRSTDYLNDIFTINNINCKILLFLREDILLNVSDTDINKIKRDSSINLNWADRTSDLKEVIKKRLIFSGMDETITQTYLDNMFPNSIKNKNYWDYLLDFTLYKPRDIIQYFKCCQTLYPDKQTLSYSEVQTAIKYYSREYLIEEMKNELAGFVKDSLISVISTAFKKIATRAFTLEEFKYILKDQSFNINYDDSDIKYLLYLLFESGYVGQLHTTGKNTSVQFKYRNPAAKIDYADKFILHRGIYIGLGINL